MQIIATARRQEPKGNRAQQGRPMETTMTLKDQGYRFLVREDRKASAWVHPAEITPRAAGWTDCTDMDDAEFDAFMAAAEA